LGTNGQLFPLPDNTGGAAVDQVQQEHLFISNLHRCTLGLYLFTSNYQYFMLMIKIISTYCANECSYRGGHLFPNDEQIQKKNN
jgi:hypothetical protein